MEKMNTHTNTASAIFFIATAAMLIGGLAAIVVVTTISVQEAQAQSGTNSEVCQQTDPYNVHRFNEACIGTKTNPSNPNTPCDNGKEFGGNKTGRANC